MNAAARVESLTKLYRVHLFATGNFIEKLNSSPEARLVDRVRVAGKSVPLELIEIRNTCSAKEFGKIAGLYGKGFELYQTGQFHEAEAVFRQLSSIDKPSLVLANRCAEFDKNPPENWQGVFSVPGK